MNEVNILDWFLHTVPPETMPTITGTFIYYLFTDACLIISLPANSDKKKNRICYFEWDCDALNLKLKCLLLGTAYIKYSELVGLGEEKLRVH